MASLPEIPEGLAEYADKIRESERDAVRVKLKPAKDLTLWQSKVGGIPYMPITADYPMGPAGEPLKLLAQINLAEIPPLRELPPSGILQFYTDPFDEMMGLGSEFDHTGQIGFRVLYFDAVEPDINKLKLEDPLRMEVGKMVNASNGKEYLGYYWPLSGEYSMEFEPFRQVMTSADYRIGTDIFGCDEDYPQEECLDLYDEHFGGSGHQICGYPYFTQEDPRTKSDLRTYELLFQLGSEYFAEDPSKEILWGDVGVANFFIRPEDLANRDFTKVMYNWDCY